MSQSLAVGTVDHTTASEQRTVSTASVSFVQLLNLV